MLFVLLKVKQQTHTDTDRQTGTDPPEKNLRRHTQTHKDTHTDTHTRLCMCVHPIGVAGIEKMLFCQNALPLNCKIIIELSFRTLPTFSLELRLSFSKRKLEVVLT